MSMREKVYMVQVYQTSWFYINTDNDGIFHYGKYVWVSFQ